MFTASLRWWLQWLPFTPCSRWLQGLKQLLSRSQDSKRPKWFQWKWLHRGEIPQGLPSCHWELKTPLGWEAMTLNLQTFSRLNQCTFYCVIVHNSRPGCHLYKPSLKMTQTQAKERVEKGTEGQGSVMQDSITICSLLRCWLSVMSVKKRLNQTQVQPPLLPSSSSSSYDQAGHTLSLSLTVWKCVFTHSLWHYLDKE